jgi:hypothetical protein
MQPEKAGIVSGQIAHKIFAIKRAMAQARSELVGIMATMF